MDPRLKTSTQWSPFPEELTEQIKVTLKERFEGEYDLEGMSFVVEGRIYPGEIILRSGLSVTGQLKQHNFEVSFEYDNEKEQTLERIQASMDVIEHIWTDFLEEDMEDSEMPREWQTMPLEKIMYFFKYSTVNSQLESEADKLLEEFDGDLLNDQKEMPDFKVTQNEETTIH